MEARCLRNVITTFEHFAFIFLLGSECMLFMSRIIHLKEDAGTIINPHHVPGA